MYEENSGCAIVSVVIVGIICYEIGILGWLLKWCLIIVAVIAAIIFVISLISDGISSLVDESKIKKMNKDVRDYGPGSIGNLIARGNREIVEGTANVKDLTRQTNEAEHILKWLGDMIERNDYTIMFDDESGPDIYTYSIEMYNSSGYDFDMFSCEVQLYEGHKRFTSSWGKVLNWRKNTTGAIEFTCPTENLTGIYVDAYSVKYRLWSPHTKSAPNVPDPPRVESFDVVDDYSANLESDADNLVEFRTNDPGTPLGEVKRLVRVHFREGDKGYDYLCDDEDIGVGDKVIVPGYSGEAVATVERVRKTMPEDLDLNYGRYKEVIRKATAEDEQPDEAKAAATPERSSKPAAESAGKSASKTEKKAEDILADIDEAENEEDEEALEERREAIRDEIESNVDMGLDPMLGIDIDDEEIAEEILEEMDIDPYALDFEKADDSLGFDSEELEEEEAAADVCPECGAPYDGIECMYCGHKD